MTGNDGRLPFGTTYPLYDGTPPHVAGSDTSYAAAEAAGPNVGKMQARILECFATINGRDGDGWTCDEMEAITGYTHQSCSARVRELVQLGRLEDSGVRRQTRHGRAARVYQLRGRSPSP